MSVPIVKLPDGNTMPKLGLGLWKVKEQVDLNTAVDSALKDGYTLFDTAEAYGNEEWLGQALSRAEVKRSDLFITSKIAVQNFGHKKAITSFHESLEKLDMEYVDLMLLHFPVTLLRKKSWQALEELKAQGLSKSIEIGRAHV